jgi:hypothetical protein
MSEQPTPRDRYEGQALELQIRGLKRAQDRALVEFRGTPEEMDLLAAGDADTIRSVTDRLNAGDAGPGWNEPSIFELKVKAWRTLADISDDPPAPLLLDMLEPDGPNLLNAAGGVGKGMTGAWMCRELLALGLKPMIFDAERRGREWSRRVSGLGADRGSVIYVAPGDLPHALLGRPLWDVAPYLGQIVRTAGADVLIIDSVLTVVGVGEDRIKSDPQVPYKYVAALDELAIPSVSFGHPPKGQPDGEPFGSVAWTNAMRLTWNGTRAEGEAHRVRWRPRKRNERGHIPGVLLTFSYGVDGRPESVVREDDEASTRDWVLAALAGGPRTTAELAEERLAENEEHVTEDVLKRTKEGLRQVLRRLDRDGLVEKHGPAHSPNVKWGLTYQ